jgi:hypothetical protein
MATLKEIYEELDELQLKAKQIMYHANYGNYEDLSGIDYDRTDAEQLFLGNELKQILERLDDVTHTLDYLNRPIKAVGVLHKNERGRYEMENGHEFSSGCGLEYLAMDDSCCGYDKQGEYIQVPYWCSSSVEHNGKDYYVVGCKEPLEGMKVRYR